MPTFLSQPIYAESFQFHANVPLPYPPKSFSHFPLSSIQSKILSTLPLHPAFPNPIFLSFSLFLSMYRWRCTYIYLHCPRRRVSIWQWLWKEVVQIELSTKGTEVQGVTSGGSSVGGSGNVRVAEPGCQRGMCGDEGRCKGGGPCVKLCYHSPVSTKHLSNK